ncbi:hypothetical protein CLOM_g10937 [Closterium sp. NIES-68]|nr:hypothetical protein CLOM_g10937 [Closterium sp. NIES-68]GJP57802.1 hypothetical protein CLOP_g17394 [Closterium sp. NIES-67]
MHSPIFSLSSLPTPTAVLFLIVGFQLGWISTSLLLPAWQQQYQQQEPCLSPDDPGCQRGSAISILSFSSSSVSGATTSEPGTGSEEPCNATLLLLKQQQEAILLNLQQQQAGIRRLQERVAARNSTILSEIAEPACANDTMPRVGTIHWNPKPQRFLIALCSGGQLSNRLACLRQNMLDAALMNRTLVIPTQLIDYDYDALLDLGAFDECVGPGRVITFSAYNASVRGRVRVGRYICHVHAYQTEQTCDALRLSYETRLHASFAKHEVARKRTPGPWFKYPTAEFIRKFHGDHHVIAFANMFGVGGREFRFHGRAPLVVRRECRGLLQPSRAIQEAAVGFINTFLGSRFIAIHLRRGDFFHHCIHGDGSRRAVPCYHPIQQLAHCLHLRLQALPGAVMVFVASNAGEEEMRVLSETLTTLVRGGG